MTVISFDYYLGQVENSENLKTNLNIVRKSKHERIEKISQDYLNSLEDISPFYPSISDLTGLPAHTVLIQIDFKLAKPYTSKDEGQFLMMKVGDKELPLENPLVRDTLTGLPMVRPSTWKGHLRFAAERVAKQPVEDRNKIIRRLFGETKTASQLKGRLYFFPTFFQRTTNRYVLTPLDRETRTPVPKRSPINLEVIAPRNATGTFSLLYFPYPKEEKNTPIETDLKFLAEALLLMFYYYGFSAKKSAGFGIIRPLHQDDVKVTPDEFKDCFACLWQNHGR